MPVTKPTSETQARLLTPEQAAAFLNISRVLVIRQARAGRIPAVKIGKAWRFRLPAIEEWVRAQETGV